MAYSQNYEMSAKRHHEAADLLYPGPRKDVAGYLYGVAAECAVKQLMWDSGMRPRRAEPHEEGRPRTDDPFFEHFPALKTLLRTAHGRRQGELAQLSSDGSFMNHWNTDMRYAPQKDIQPTHVTRWKEDARRVLLMMEGL